MTQQIETNDAVQAIDQNLLLKARDGYAWISGLDANAGNGDMTVDLTAGDAFVDGTVHSVGADSVTVPDADPDVPRKDLIYVDATGALTVETGTPDGALPEGTAREHTYSPAPPPAATLAGTPLWEVWVAAGATSVATADLNDRRVPADVIFNDVTAESATVGDLTATDAAVTNAPSSATDVIRKEELDTHEEDANAHHARDHATRHQQDGADELDAADLSGAAGDDGEVLTTDGAAASWASQSGGTTFATESGSFITESSSPTTDVTLSNTYSADAFIPTVGMIPSSSSDGADGCRVSSITTDANGDVTGFVVEAYIEGGWNADYTWYVMGEVV